MPTDADLEIGLRWDRASDGLYANLRFDLPGSNTERWDQPQEPLALDLAALRLLKDDEPAYGEALTRMVLRPARRRRVLPGGAGDRREQRAHAPRAPPHQRAGGLPRRALGVAARPGQRRPDRDALRRAAVALPQQPGLAADPGARTARPPRARGRRGAERHRELRGARVAARSRRRRGRARAGVRGARDVHDGAEARPGRGDAGGRAGGARQGCRRPLPRLPRRGQPGRAADLPRGAGRDGRPGRRAEARRAAARPGAAPHRRHAVLLPVRRLRATSGGARTRASWPRSGRGWPRPASLRSSACRATWR